MSKKWFLLLSAPLVAAAIYAYSNNSDKTTIEPKLLIAFSQPGGTKMVDSQDVNLPGPRKMKIVIATHGWFEREPWPGDLALAIRDKVDSNEWLCGWFDWRKEAKFVNPRDAAQYAREKAGPLLADHILKLSKDPQHVHLIAHSAGCWAISEAAKIIASQTSASIHLTFLDAYVPLGWDANALGDIAEEPNTVFWADHYLTQDITLKVTDCLLKHAHNIDVGEITPGLKDHEFPRYWYPATVLGKYVPGDRYDGKKLYKGMEPCEYGFGRSLEAGKTNWEQSLKLPVGNDTVIIKKVTKLTLTSGEKK